MKHRIQLTFAIITLAIISIQCSEETPTSNEIQPAIMFEKVIDFGRTDISYDVKPTSDVGYVVAGEIKSKQSLQH